MKLLPKSLYTHSNEMNKVNIKNKTLNKNPE